MAEVLYPVVLLANYVIFFALVGWYLRRDCASLYHPASVYFAFHFVVFLLRPTLGYLLEFDAIYRLFEFYPTMEDRLIAQLVTILGLVVFVVVSVAVGNAPLSFVADQARYEDGRRKLQRPFLITCLLLAPISIYSIWKIIETRATGTTTMIMVNGTTINTTGNGYLTDAQVMLATLCILSAVLFRWRWYALMPMAAFLVLKSATGGRWPIVIALFSLALIYAHQHRKRWISGKLGLTAIAALGIFALVGADRGAAIRSLLTEQTVQTRGDAQIQGIDGMDFGNSEYLEYLVYAIPQRTRAYGLFLDNLQVFTEPVPRVLWKGKPVGEPFPRFNLFDYGNPIGMTFSLVGEGWAQAGYLGVALWCALYAFVLGKGYQWFMRGERTILKQIAWMMILAAMILAFRDGKLVSAVKTLSALLLPFVILLMVRAMDRYGGRVDIGATGAGRGGGRAAMTPAQRRAELAASAGQTTADQTV